ncbi:hypothetical protein NQ315_011191 [Exocentrus adspersus]|uniref:Tyr recombinase domain-containing protein n=1 Tax=Exocentrus adspersus TaxID=1586481 RepID=A0AAV8V6I8_9CUCU|nr:hypothetical protein NQ315_011191 [Exocentrus adspersus]
MENPSPYINTPVVLMVVNLYDMGILGVIIMEIVSIYKPIRVERTFVVSTGLLNGHPVYHKYLNLRPSNAKSSNLFLNYRNGKCTNQVIGKGTIGRWPSKIAEYLSLKNPAAYTGHSFRRTSAILLANKGEDILGLKRHGGWKSSSTAEGYIEDSIENKIKFAKKILHSDKKKEVLKPSTSMSDQENKENSMWGNTDIGASLLMSSVNHNNEKGELQESNDCPTDAKIMSSTSNAKVL